MIMQMTGIKYVEIGEVVCAEPNTMYHLLLDGWTDRHMHGYESYVSLTNDTV